MNKGKKLYEGKAKIIYTTTDKNLVIQYFKDDATAFNNQKKSTIEGKGVLNNRISEHILSNLSEVGIKNHLSFTSELSVGQKKRISIARWLLKDFGIYFIDEPFSALDDQATSLIIEIIEELNAKGASFVITGHRASDVISNQIFLDHEV